MTTDKFVPITWELIGIRDVEDGTDYFFEPNKTLSQVSDERWMESAQKVTDYFLGTILGRG